MIHPFKILVAALALLATGARAAENDVLLELRTATGGQRTLPLPLPPGFGIVGGPGPGIQAPIAVDLSSLLGGSSAIGTTVDTAPELLTAVNDTGGTIYVLGEITLPNPGTGTAIFPTPCLWIKKPGTQLIGMTKNGVRAKLICPTIPAKSSLMIRVSAPDVIIQNLELTTNKPVAAVTTPPDLYDLGIATYADVPGDISIGTPAHRLVVDRCDIHHLDIALYRTSGGSPLAKVQDTRYVNNYIHAFRKNAAKMDGDADGVLFDFNRIKGQDETSPGVFETNPTGTGLFIGSVASQVSRVTISRNWVSNLKDNGLSVGDVNGHAIETFNVTDAQILNNRINDCVFGISTSGNGTTIISGNQMVKAKSIGIEMYNDPGQTTRYVVSGNSIDFMEPLPGQISAPCCMLIGSVNAPSIVQGNYFGRVSSLINEAAGIEFWDRGVLQGVSNVTVLNNTFFDCGTKAVWVNNITGNVMTRINIDANTFYYSAAYAALHGPGGTGSVGTPDGWDAIRVHDARKGTFSVRHNTVWYPIATTQYGGLAASMIVATPACKISSGSDAGDPVITVTTGPAQPIAQSNLRIPYDP